jgi:hypothetical protein
MNRIFASLIFFCATFVVTPLAAFASFTTVPPGLSPGDQYRLAFLTRPGSTTTAATSTDINYYNNFVNSVANSPGSLVNGLSTWTAIASTATVAAEDNTGTNPSSSQGFPIYTLNGTLVAVDNASLWSGSIINPILWDQIDAGDSTPVWTGTTPSGTPSLAALGTANPMYGHVNGTLSPTTSAWIADGTSYGTLGQSSPFSLYGISGVLTAPAVPEPSTLVLACIAAAGLAVRSLRRRRLCKR